MWLTSLRESLRPTPRPRSRPRRGSPFRPWCERLETRWVPATVTSLDDAGAGSLRQAILDTAPGETVDFEAGLTGTITLTTGELAIDKDLVIRGPDASLLTVSGNHQSRVFSIAAGVNVEIYALTIQDGSVLANGASGGGILNEGNLLLYSSNVIDNRTATASPAISGSASGGGIQNTGTMTIVYSTIANNSTSSSGTGIKSAAGGGISNLGALALIDTVVSGNIASASSDVSSSSSGGGISSSGTLYITRSVLHGNRASASGNLNASTGSGGGIHTSGSTTVFDSTLSDNTVTAVTSSSGGALFMGTGDLTIHNSTLSGNQARATRPTLGNAFGGGLSYGSRDAGSVTGSTITGNSVTGSAIAGGGGISASPSLAVRNTIVAGNTAASGPDVRGTLDSLGHNLIGDGSGGDGYAETDLVGSSEALIDPLLGPLEDNGGPTPTHALLPGSPALDAGDPTDAPEFDQRGEGFWRIMGSTIDIGAFEVQCAGPSLDAGPRGRIELWQLTTPSRSEDAGLLLAFLSEFGSKGRAHDCRA